MSLLKKINRYRKAVMKLITKNLGRTRLDGKVDVSAREKISRLLICRPNHRLGNLLLITPLLQEVMETLPHAKVDLFVKGGLGPVLFKNYPNVDRIIQLPKKPMKDVLHYLGGWISLRKRHYDIVINVVNHSSSGRISAQVANAEFKFLGEINETIEKVHPDHAHMAKYPVYSFRNYIQQLGFRKNEQQVPPLDLKLSLQEIAEGRKQLEKLVSGNRKTICLYTYATGAKMYPSTWWEDFYTRLLAQYPEYNIVELLPVENVSQLSFKIPSLYSKDLRLIGSFLANTSIFIGADSGMMHLASASSVPTVGLFKTTNMDVYAPYNDHSVGINTDTVGMEGCLDAVKTILQAHGKPVARTSRH